MFRTLTFLLSFIVVGRVCAEEYIGKTALSLSLSLSVKFNIIYVLWLVLITLLLVTSYVVYQ